MSGEINADKLKLLRSKINAVVQGEGDQTKEIKEISDEVQVVIADEELVENISEQKDEKDLKSLKEDIAKIKEWSDDQTRIRTLSEKQKAEKQEQDKKVLCDIDDKLKSMGEVLSKPVKEAPDNTKTILDAIKKIPKTEFTESPFPLVAFKTLMETGFVAVKDALQKQFQKIKIDNGRNNPLFVTVVDKNGKYITTINGGSVGGGNTGAFHTGFVDVNNDEAYALVDDENKLIISSLEGLSIPIHDYISASYNDPAFTETYTYKTGGSGGSTVATVVVIYTDATKEKLVSVTKT